MENKHYYQVYINGQWHRDFATYEEAETYVNANAGLGECVIEKFNI